MVPMYSPGLPMMMAVFQAVGGERAAYFVVPLTGAVAVWATFLLGRALADPLTGLIASALLLSSPPFLYMLVQPMSDIPAAAAWAAGLAFAGRGRRLDAAFAGLLALGRVGDGVRVVVIATISRPVRGTAAGPSG